MNLAQKAFELLNINESREIRLTYSGKFKDFNANAKYSHSFIEFQLSKSWISIDEDIQIGLIQSLIIKILKLKTKTMYTEMYESFIKNLSKYAKKHSFDSELVESFNRVNEKFFNNLMDKPNLIFANQNFTKLGSYEYNSDTVYISSIFRNLSEIEKEYLDYVVYHELLHKKHSFKVKNGRHHAHTSEFRRDEEKFGIGMEKKLTQFLRKKKYGFRNFNSRSINSQSINKSKNPIRKLFEWW